MNSETKRDRNIGLATDVDFTFFVQVKLFFSGNNQLLQRMAMPHKIKNLCKKIDGIKKEGRRDLSLVPPEPRAEGSRNEKWNVGERYREGEDNQPPIDK